MAEQIETPDDDSLQAHPTGVATRSRVRGLAARRAKPRRPARVTSASASPRRGSRPLRSLVILTMVGGLVATVALPAYGAWRAPAEAAVTLQQVAADDAQSLVVASDATSEELDRGGYAATTPEEIAKKKAEEAAAARARQLASAKAASSGSVYSMNLSMTAPGSGEVRWPVTNFTYSSINLFRPPNRPNHNGFDMLAPAGTPIFAAAAGVVRISQESYSGYGVAVTIDSVVGGQQVSTLYGHMTYGSRQVVSGQSVSAGQLIGAVGSTGSSTANHLHFEVRINGALADPLAWLQANAG
ncbi:M23 family metallopeptidase [Microbacterium sp. SS28]|uniref:M23 family metallopeptidase n=1 Tax=Microbacterium sp. SS28 TaxID=2919948 RepID=UPI001FAB27F0|nr:M23 family metallopeptidase [Microbacterium sp. SS28]